MSSYNSIYFVTCLHFLVKENNVAADCIKLLFHAYVNASVVPFKVPDTALCTLWKNPHEEIHHPLT